jgi:hypothetical protein
MPQPTTRPEFIQHCLRALGAPVVEINVDDDQIDDRVTEAFEFYNAFLGDATEKTFLKHKVTADDIENEYISIPNSELILSITNVLPINSSNASSLFSIDYQIHLNSMWDIAALGNLTNYYLQRSWLSLLELVISGESIHFDYNPHKNQIKLHVDWDTITEDSYVVFECYRVIDPVAYPDVYSDSTLQAYAAALIKRQWGINLSKFDGMVMPGGVTFNGRQILEDANEEIKSIAEDARLTWEDPVDFYTG